MSVTGTGPSEWTLAAVFLERETGAVYPLPHLGIVFLVWESLAGPIGSKEGLEQPGVGAVAIS